MIRATMFAMGLFCSAMALAAPPEDRYAAEWADRADAAVTADQRGDLAADLLAAAKAADDVDYAVLLCFKAYAFGSRQIEGFDTAADALELAQRLAPDRRLECLDRLRYLYDTAYQRSPHKLRLGVGLAEVLGELADGRADQAVGRFEVGRLDPVEAARRIARAVADAERGVDVLNKVLTRAREDRVKALRFGRDDLAEALRRFVDEHRPMLAEAVEARGRFAATHQRFVDLSGNLERFAKDPSPANAQSVAGLYLIEFDQPERISPQVLAALPGSVSGPAKLAAQRAAALDADEALMLCRWYRDLAERPTTVAARRAMLIRARLYADRVAALGDERAAEHRAPIAAALAEAGLSADQAASRVAALSARLDAVGRGEAALTDAAPVAADEPGGEDEPPMLTDASDHTVGGRPMTLCEKCGRHFFPGWGVEAAACERCEQGHRNIFDFGR